MTAADFAERLDARRSGAGWEARCPAHEDERASLSIAEGEGGRVLLTCHAGCAFKTIAEHAGVAMHDLMGVDSSTTRPVRRNGAPAAKSAPPLLSNAQVEAMHRALREDPKAWAYVERLRLAPEVVAEARLGLQVVDGARRLAYPYRAGGRWTWANARSLDGQEPKYLRPRGASLRLYRVDTLEPGGTAIVTEGERDALAALTMGLPAELGGESGAAVVAIPGASNVRLAVEGLRGQRKVFVCTDADDQGDEAAAKIIAELGPRAVRFRPPGGFKDFGDLLSALGAEEAQRVALAALKEAKSKDASDLEQLSVRLSDLDRSHLENGVPLIATGWQRIDAALGGGLEVPSLNVLGAAPKSGKSTWAQIAAVRHVEAGGFVYYLDLENGRRRFLRRLLCRRSGLDAKAVARALRDERAGVFASPEAAAQWRADLAWLNETVAPALLLETKPPADLEARLRHVRSRAGARKLLVVLDSLQKLPGDLEDRRATVDGWVRMFERLRLDLDAVFLLVSEIKRDRTGAYVAHEAAFKESGGIEYAADLAMTLTRPRADEAEEEISTLRVELARDCDEDPRGEVASYRPVRPHYGLEEVDPVAIRTAKRRPSKAEDAVGWLRDLLAQGAVRVSEALRVGKSAGYSEATIQRAKRTLGVQACTVELQHGWKLP